MIQSTTDIKRKAFNQIKKELEQVSSKMVELITLYDLDVSTPLEIISTARKKIDKHDDYVLFLELSLQGRLLGETAEHLDSTTTIKQTDGTE